jgi:WD40 repeat protein
VVVGGSSRMRRSWSLQTKGILQYYAELNGRKRCTHNMKLGPSVVLLWLFTLGNKKASLSRRQTRCFSLLYQPVLLATDPNDAKGVSLAKSSGVTSLVNFPPGPLRLSLEVNDTTNTSFSYDILAGTKRGDVAVIRFVVGSQELYAAHIATLSSRGDDGVVPTSSLKLPIFSLAVDKETRTLFVGGGDRYVSVWQQQQEQPVGNCWVGPKQRLGPHTGWVRAMTLSRGWGHQNPRPRRRRRRLYSVGCNRIETWEKRNVDGGSEWTHAATIFVDSCPEMESGGACTLSSDLLCLGHCRCRLSLESSGAIATVSVLAAGGVDGRIHFFWEPFGDTDSDTDGRNMQKVIVVAAHQGRVNALHYDHEQQLLFSASHDGTVQCWSLAVEDAQDVDRQPTSSCRSNLSVARVASHTFNDAPIRVTALACWKTTRDNFDLVNVVAGTNNGLVCVLSLRARNSTAPSGQTRKLYEFSLVEKVQIRCSNADNTLDTPTINALCPLPHASGTVSKSLGSTTIVVGHSHGLGFLTATTAA